MKKIIYLLSAMTLLLGLIACGGGGGGGPVPPNPNPTPNNGLGSAELLELSDEPGSSPDIAMAGDGKGVAVWTQTDGIRDRIWMRFYDPATGWGTPEAIDDPNQEDGPYSPKVAMNDTGEAVVVWTQAENDSFIPSLWASRYDTSSGWSTPIMIEAESGWATSPEIDMDNQGNAIAIWWQVEVISQGNSRERIYANRLTSGNWQGAIGLDDGNTDVSWFPLIKMSPGGNAIAVWLNKIDADSHGVYASRFSVNTGWSEQEQITTTTEAIFPTDIHVSQINDDERIVMWSILDDSVNSYLQARHFNGTAWQTIQDLGEGNLPYLTSNHNGQVIAVYSLFSISDPNGIYTIQFSQGTWQPRQRIDNFDQLPGHSRIAINSNGEAIATWQQFVPQSSHDVLHANYFDGTNWQTAVVLDDRDSGDMNRSELDIDDSGHAIVVWEQNTSGDNIWSNRFTWQ